MSTPVPSPAYRYPLTVVSNEQVAPSFWRMTFSCPELARSIEPGQFFNLAVPGDPSQPLRLPFSYAAADAEAGEVTFGYLVQGDGTRRMTRMAAGCASDLVGPAGHGWRLPEPGGRALLVGGGSGVVPLVPLVGALVGAGCAADFVEGAPTAARVTFEAEVRAAGAERFEVSTDDGTRGLHGFCTEVAARLLAERPYDVVYTCGPTPMMRGVAKAALEAGVACQVSMEEGMMCGFGACNTCAVDTTSGRRGACMCGPVFDAKEVVW